MTVGRQSGARVVAESEGILKTARSLVYVCCSGHCKWYVAMISFYACDLQREVFVSKPDFTDAPATQSSDFRLQALGQQYVYG